jgi:hypothetical protein
MNKQQIEYHEIIIVPSSGGFGEWQSQRPNGDGWASQSDLLAAIVANVRGELIELGVDALPDGVDDIRGAAARRLSDLELRALVRRAARRPV